MAQDLWLVNGAEQPTLTVKTTEWHRLRLVMAGVSTWLYLSFGDCEVWVGVLSRGETSRGRLGCALGLTNLYSFIKMVHKDRQGEVGIQDGGMKFGCKQPSLTIISHCRWL